MGCIQSLKGLSKPCECNNRGGIKKVYLANRSWVTAITVSTGKVSAITMAAGTGEATQKFKGYNFSRGTASMTSTATIDRTGNVSFIGTDVVMQFNRADTIKREEMTAMPLADMYGIVEDMNGKFWLLGKDEPIYASAGTFESGTARGDVNKYGITLHDESDELPFEVDSTIIANIVSEPADLTEC